MDQTQSLQDTDNAAPIQVPESLARCQRLRAIVTGENYFLDSPNTSEAFARLEAAIRKAEQPQPTSSDMTMRDQMPDPPTTAKCFARIEAAVDGVPVRSNTVAATPRRLRKVRPNRNEASRSQSCVRVQDSRCKDSGGASQATSGACQTYEPQGSGIEVTVGKDGNPWHGVNVFQDAEAARNFANKIFQWAKAKYL